MSPSLPNPGYETAVKKAYAMGHVAEGGTTGLGTVGVGLAKGCAGLGNGVRPGTRGRVVSIPGSRFRRGSI